MNNNYRNDVVDLDVNNTSEPIGESIGFDAQSDVWGMPVIVWLVVGLLAAIALKPWLLKKKS